MMEHVVRNNAALRKPLIATDFKREQLARAFDGWVGTPFAPYACVRGAGVDCVHLVHDVLLQCKCRLPAIRMQYAIDRASHTERSLLVEWIEAHPKQLQQVDVQEMQSGDVLGIRIERCVHHAGIVLDERLFGHVTRGYRVTKTLLRMIPRYGKLEYVWRPMR